MLNKLLIWRLIAIVMVTVGVLNWVWQVMVFTTAYSTSGTFLSCNVKKYRDPSVGAELPASTVTEIKGLVEYDHAGKKYTVPFDDEPYYAFPCRAGSSVEISIFHNEKYARFYRPLFDVGRLQGGLAFVIVGLAIFAIRHESKKWNRN